GPARPMRCQCVRGGGGRPGHRIGLTVDTAGRWRPGYSGRQWDSTSHRQTAELRAMLSAVGVACPAAAKDVSMAGSPGTLGMLTEASGCRAVLDVAAVPKPASVTGLPASRGSGCSPPRRPVAHRCRRHRRSVVTVASCCLLRGGAALARWGTD
ncbi:MAG TPA: hypothetical protein VHH52_06675, partial [Pseudonocardiaceae bacterium]|nr:hypothetical protein [Pseudonocardiaceae bacterium]